MNYDLIKNNAIDLLHNNYMRVSYGTYNFNFALSTKK